MKKERVAVKPGTNVGFVSMLTIFMTLCLATFAALALSTQAGDKNLSARMQNSVKNYYEAENNGQAFLATLDSMLVELRAESANDIEYFQKIEGRIDSILTEGIGYDEAGHKLYIDMMADERVMLKGSIEINLREDRERYRVTQWLLTPVTEEVEEDINDLWNGEL